jgi:gluconokinase
MVVLVMGVAGSGKTTVGQRLAAELGWHFVDADDLHPRANVEKMAAGVALTDEDRGPWLERLRGEVERALEAGEPLVLACSALKRAYRERLVVDPTRVRLVYLSGSRELLASRLAGRRGHFMPPSLLDSQLEALEPPAGAVRVDVSAEPAEVVAAVRAGLGV